MLRHRVIPSLLLRDGHLVKTLRFSAPKYIGDPINAIRIFNEKEVDELFVLDIEASKAGREPDYNLIEQFASECFMPLAYGGGIRSVEQARRLFSAGVEKVSLQTSALQDLEIVRQIATRYGNQSVVVSIDIKKTLMGRQKLWSFADGQHQTQDWRDFLQDAIEAGAGEILLNAVDRDGTMGGMDLSLIQAAVSICSVPLIACGGTGSLADIREAVEAGASGVAAGALFVFYGPHRAVLISYPKYEELVALFNE